MDVKFRLSDRSGLVDVRVGGGIGFDDRLDRGQFSDCESRP